MLASLVMGNTHPLTSGYVREEPSAALHQSGVPALLLFCYFAFLALQHPETYWGNYCCWRVFLCLFRENTYSGASRICVQKHIPHCFSLLCYLDKVEWKRKWFWFGSVLHTFCRAVQAYTICGAVVNHSLSSSSLHTSVTTLFCWTDFWFTGWEISRL